MTGGSRFQLSDATIGIITALQKEYIAVCTAMGCSTEVSADGVGAGRKYSLGEICTPSGGKHVIAAALLTGPGNNAAGIRATLMTQHFKPKYMLFVGIAGAVPHPTKAEQHVRLGDVVVSGQGGVVQYDFVKETLLYSGKFRLLRHLLGHLTKTPVNVTEPRFPPRPPSAELLEAVQLLESDRLKGEYPWEQHTDQVITTLGQAEWGRPAESKDRLKEWKAYPRDVKHPVDPDRRAGRPRVFIATIAAGNKLLKNPVVRDQLRDKYGARAVEMEASGFADACWNSGVGYLVVRGTCDYCNPDKGDDWQKYAAAAAAGYARSVIEKLDASGPAQREPSAAIQPQVQPGSSVSAEAELERARADRIHAEHHQEIIRHLLQENAGLRSQLADGSTAPTTTGVPNIPSDTNNNNYAQPRPHYDADTNERISKETPQNDKKLSEQDAQAEARIAASRFEQSVENGAKIEEPIATQSSDADKKAIEFSDRLERMGKELEFETAIPFVDTTLIPWIKTRGDKLQDAIYNKLCRQISKFKLRQARLTPTGTARDVCLAEAELFIEKAKHVR